MLYLAGWDEGLLVTCAKLTEKEMILSVGSVLKLLQEKNSYRDLKRWKWSRPVCLCSHTPGESLAVHEPEGRSGARSVFLEAGF